MARSESHQRKRIGIFRDTRLKRSKNIGTFSIVYGGGQEKKNSANLVSVHYIVHRGWIYLYFQLADDLRSSPSRIKAKEDKRTKWSALIYILVHANTDVTKECLQSLWFPEMDH